MRNRINTRAEIAASSSLPTSRKVGASCVKFFRVCARVFSSLKRLCFSVISQRVKSTRGVEFVRDSKTAIRAKFVSGPCPRVVGNVCAGIESSCRVSISLKRLCSFVFEQGEKSVRRLEIARIRVVVKPGAECDRLNRVFISLKRLCLFVFDQCGQSMRRLEIVRDSKTEIMMKSTSCAHAGVFETACAGFCSLCRRFDSVRHGLRVFCHELRVGQVIPTLGLLSLGTGPGSFGWGGCFEHSD